MQGHMYGKKAKWAMCPFRYWTAREGNSECTARCCQCHQSPETKGHMYGQKPKGHLPFSYWSVVHVIKVQRQKDICIGESQMDMCHFSYWRAREGNSESTGKFHQSSETKKSDL